MNARRKVKIKKTGFKKITVKYPKVKIKKKGSGCGDMERDPNYQPVHTKRRRAGRMIKKMRLKAEQGKQTKKGKKA